MTYLCVAIYVNSLEQGRADALRAAEAGADLVEYRVDTFTDPRDLLPLVESSPVPCIVTCRSFREGGQAAIDDDQRIALLASPGGFHARYVDVELVTLRDHRGRAQEL